MSWRIVAAAVVGTAHQARGEACQDYCLATTWQAADGNEYLVALVADGAGSASCGQAGAELVCQEGQRLITASLVEHAGALPTYEVVAQWINDLRGYIEARAATTQMSSREYACTILIAVVAPQYGMFAQIGDGGIVATRAGLLQPVLWPAMGEYANETHFLTDANVLQHLQYTCWETCCTEVALFSDGLQRLALVYDNRTVHLPFFAPMLAVMHQVTPAFCALLNGQLADFLASTRVNERTDDDKTLVLAIYHDDIETEHSSNNDRTE